MIKVYIFNKSDNISKVYGFKKFFQYIDSEIPLTKKDHCSHYYALLYSVKHYKNSNFEIMTITFKEPVSFSSFHFLLAVFAVLLWVVPLVLTQSLSVSLSLNRSPAYCCHWLSCHASSNNRIAHVQLKNLKGRNMAEILQLYNFWD